jgi:hypothetical protein
MRRGLWLCRLVWRKRGPGRGEPAQEKENYDGHEKKNLVYCGGLLSRTAALIPIASM